MAVDPRTGERVYAAIKQGILAGELKLRQRLDIDTLADRLSASATPVRQALAILSAERLVTAHASRGYYVAFWSERELSALYEWRWQLAQLATLTFEVAPDEARPTGSVIEIYQAMMRRLERNANDEVKRAAQNTDERLRAAHMAEVDIIPGIAEELKGLRAIFDAGDRRKIGRSLKSYFKRRLDAVPAIRARASVAALPRNGDE
jgi:DNA-binding GntR family transcriptional regulator